MVGHFRRWWILIRSWRDWSHEYKENTHVGVPQGSLLGPFLFHILNNDISDINLKSNQIRLFADHIYVLVVVVDNSRNAAKSLTADPEIVKNVLE